ncbi:MAG TPA: hypothetical protein VGK53_08890 [Propionicimonas sp.]
MRLFSRRTRRLAAETRPWGRDRLLAALAGVLVAAVMLAAGLGMAIWQAIVPRTDPGIGSVVEPGDLVLTVRDRIAAAPMASVGPEAAFSPDPVIAASDEIRVPIATIASGPANVPTGFPRTPEGAVGQLAAIEKTVLESMSLPLTGQVHTAWVQPGGPSLADWELTRDVQTFLASARQGGTEKDPTTLVAATPAAAMVKGSDGPDWTLVCVLMDIRAAIRTESRMGYGFCSRMAWNPNGDRWQVAAGPVPARAPSAWPGSRAAAAAGWLTWTEEMER